MRTSTAHRIYPFVTAVLIFANGCGSADKRVLEEVVEKVYTIEADANLSIQNRDGAVLVYGGEPNEIRVQAIKKAYSPERLNQIGIDVSRKPGGISVTTRLPALQKWALLDRSGTVDYTIVVPMTASISGLDLNAGEILLDNLRGREVHARLSDGCIFVRNCFTNVDLTMDRGTCRLWYDWWTPQQFLAQVNMGQGNAWVFLPSDAAFHLLAHAVHGKIANDFNSALLTNKSSARGMNIDQIVNGGGSAILNIRVDNGSIKVGEANP